MLIDFLKYVAFLIFTAIAGWLVGYGAITLIVLFVRNS